MERERRRKKKISLADLGSSLQPEGVSDRTPPTPIIQKELLNPNLQTSELESNVLPISNTSSKVEQETRNLVDSRRRELRPWVKSYDTLELVLDPTEFNSRYRITPEKDKLPLYKAKKIINPGIHTEMREFHDRNLKMGVKNLSNFSLTALKQFLENKYLS